MNDKKSLSNIQGNISLEDIALRKAEILDDIRTQKGVITETTRKAFAPYSSAATTGNSLLNTFNTGVAVFDGMMLGLKVMRRIRRFFDKH
ncbi:hypothetical protein [uncultured Bacteroides sp.]|uniref:hypothetical protein n=1 Tax=uncultured Bacteroides sp. TaxID=162156 RepID=UPI002AA5FBA9|nr:hypothetical protein [uncultured Bacteroides sp.]